MPRLFVAVPVAESVRASLAEVASAARLPGWRWVRPEAVHLTLAFLGDVDEVRVPAAEGAMRHAARTAPAALALRAEGLGAFPSERRARVVWAGVAGEVEALAALQQALGRHLEAVGFPRDAPRFEPHLTLARLRAPRPVPAGFLTHRAFGAWRAAELQLVESHLGSARPRYEVRAFAPLGEGRGCG